MRKLLMVSLVAAMGLIFVGCGDDDTSPTDSGGNNSGGGGPPHQGELSSTASTF